MLCHTMCVLRHPGFSRICAILQHVQPDSCEFKHLTSQAHEAAQM